MGLLPTISAGKFNLILMFFLSLLLMFVLCFKRKKGLLYNNVLAIIAALLMGLSKTCNSYEMIIIGRFFIGLNCGLNSGLCPTYITEIAPIAIRGSIGTLFQ